ncbi:sigma-70 family RNA polymerase sigma factor [Sphingomonas sp. FW199]|uniref:sigma-70 family RNA polymerase sigma factor n=1 Tax=unclassified Sphingomonas TaxID=196159 RepID=UPI0021A38A2D|nr:sigma-70 family RNA polymerase sigma factor [Sphingomonas sp. BGYR3]MDG5487209.1 sigma-70 family RNA polymerase sigma factor [Sphingomonas sp. BGYR3]
MSDPDDARSALAMALSRVGAGDRAALREVYDRTVSKLFGICLRICGEREAAEDVVQDVFVKVWHSAGRFDPSRASPITWLATIARNTAIDRVRSTRTRVLLPETAAANIADAAPLAPDRIVEAQMSSRIHACLDELDERSRDLIRTAYFDGVTYAALAERTDTPLGTVKSLVRRGLMRLRGCVGDD